MPVAKKARKTKNAGIEIVEDDVGPHNDEVEIVSAEEVSYYVTHT